MAIGIKTLMVCERLAPTSNKHPIGSISRLRRNQHFGIRANPMLLSMPC